MPLTVVSDNETLSAHVHSRPRRPVTLSSWLTDTNNDATPELTIHRREPQLGQPAVALQNCTAATPVQTGTGSKRRTEEVLSLLSDDTDAEDHVEKGPRKSECYLFQVLPFVLTAAYFHR
jgi:hypothetical protein